jgi:hypothetical protein
MVFRHFPCIARRFGVHAPDCHVENILMASSASLPDLSALDTEGLAVE